MLAEGVGFEPTVALRLLLISSQMPLTTQPPFLPLIYMHFISLNAFGLFHCTPPLHPVDFNCAILTG